MKDDQRQRIIDRHRHSIWRYGYSPQALYIENREVQEVRFEVLLSAGLSSGDSVLDVGCGFADLYRYMRGKGVVVEYTGIDLSPEMIEAAKASTPGVTLFSGDLFDLDPAPQTYDWVLLSGSLNEPLKDDGAYLKAIVPRLYAACRKGLAFNLLNDDYAWTAQQLHNLQPYNTAEVMAMLATLSPHTRLRTDYLDVDASFFAWRSADDMPAA